MEYINPTAGYKLKRTLLLISPGSNFFIISIADREYKARRYIPYINRL